MTDKYYVTYWDSGEVYMTFPKLAIAKKYARGLGHTGEDNPILTGYPPVAYVANDEGQVLYNPRFPKNIPSSLGSIVTNNDDCLRG